MSKLDLFTAFRPTARSDLPVSAVARFFDGACRIRAVSWSPIECRKAEIVLHTAGAGRPHARAGTHRVPLRPRSPATRRIFEWGAEAAVPVTSGSPGQTPVHSESLNSSAFWNSPCTGSRPSLCGVERVADTGRRCVRRRRSHWTKTADEILASIARFAQRTLDAQAAPLISRTTGPGH